MPEEILIAADHAGFELKEKLEQQLKALGYAVRDFGTNSAESTDYPDYAHPLAKEISAGHAKRGHGTENREDLPPAASDHGQVLLSG